VKVVFRLVDCFGTGTWPPVSPIDLLYNNFSKQNKKATFHGWLSKLSNTFTLFSSGHQKMAAIPWGGMFFFSKIFRQQINSGDNFGSN